MSYNKLIFESEFPVAHSIFGVISGTEAYFIPNEFFPEATGFNTKYDTFKLLPGDDKGKRFTQTNVSIKGCAHSWHLALAESATTPKTYYFGKPDDELLSKITKKPSITLNFSANAKDVDFSEGDLNVTTFDYQVSIITTIMLVSRALGIDLKEYAKNTENTDNKKFLNNFITDVAAKVGGKATAFSTSDAFVKSWDNAPYYKDLGKGNSMLISHEDVSSLGSELNEVGDLTEPSFTTLYQDIKKKIACYAQSWKSAVKNKTLIDLFTNDKFEPRPGIIKRLYADVSGNWHKSLRIRAQIYPANNNPKYSKIQWLVAKMNKRQFLPQAKQSVVIEQKVNYIDLANLWNGKYSEESGFSTDKSFARHTGVISLKYNVENRFYAMAGPIGNWRIDKISMKKQEFERKDYSLDDRWVGDDSTREDGFPVEDILEGNITHGEDEGEAYEKPPW